MDTSLPAVDEPRERYLRVRLSKTEYESLAAAAQERGCTVSETVRRLLRQFASNSTVRVLP